MNAWLILILAAVIPGSGHVILGRPMRGLVFVFWIVIFGYVTYHLSGTHISLIGRLSGGIAVWTVSILEVNKMLRRRK